jgi:hypothetical protein
MRTLQNKQGDKRHTIRDDIVKLIEIPSTKMVQSCQKNVKPKNAETNCNITIKGTRKRGRPCKRW